MEKEALLSELTSKIGTTSLSERTISEYVDNIFSTITSDEQVNDAFWQIHTNILKSFNGNLNHEVSTRVNTFKSEWEKAHSKPEPPKVDPPKPEDDPIAKLTAEIESLKKLNAETQKKSEFSAIQHSVLTKADELKVSNKNLWNDSVLSISNSEGLTAESMLEEAKKVYERRLKSYIGDSAAPYGGASTAQRIDEAKANAKRDAFKEKMKKRGKLP